MCPVGITANKSLSVFTLQSCSRKVYCFSKATYQVTNITEVAGQCVCDQAAAVETGLAGETLHSCMSSVSLDEDAVMEVGADCPLQRSIEAIGERLTAIYRRQIHCQVHCYRGQAHFLREGPGGEEPG